MENNNTESYIISPFDSEAEVPEREFLNGLEFEKIFSSDFVPLLFQRFWDTWEQRPELEHYETIIYPQIINTIQKICKLNPLISLDIIDLGGGSGILAERILKENTLTDSLRKIVVIDRNLTLIKKAEERAVNNKKLIPRHISGKKCLRISIARLTTVKVLMSLFYVE